MPKGQSQPRISSGAQHLQGRAGTGWMLRTQHAPPGALGGREWNGAYFSRKGEILYFLHNILFGDFVTCEKASVGTSERQNGFAHAVLSILVCS